VTVVERVHPHVRATLRKAADVLTRYASQEHIGLEVLWRLSSTGKLSRGGIDECS
jgi:ribosomal protein L35AE/L33A